MSTRCSPLRLTRLGDRPLAAGGDHVLYWMVAQRRTHHNVALDRACEYARALGKPLLVLEALRCDHRWANDRSHAFVLQGMAANARACAARGVHHYAYVEPAPGAGRGLLAALAAHACIVISDEWPCSFVPAMQRRAADRLPVALELVDGNGLLPLRAAPRAFARAFDFRRFLQRELPTHLAARPLVDPLRGLRGLPTARVPRRIRERWPPASAALLHGAPAALAALPIDHDVAPSAVLAGGAAAGSARLRAFLDAGLDRYARGRNHPDDDAQSGLSPWLHFGHVGSHQVFHELTRRRGWTPDDLATTADGSNTGWWGMSANAEAFLDELVTWRELGFNFAHHRPADLDRFEALPSWARRTLDEHRDDPRPELYTLDELAESATGDAVWNAAQAQLRTEGRLHNYLRMLWGKRVLEWTQDPETAAAALIELNNRYALDGRDPNSYSGIFWVFGRYDRAWGPERPVFGKVRYMSSANTRRKLRLGAYLERHGRAAG